MKKVIIFVIIIFVLFASNATFADTILKKLGRGAANILTSPVEIVYRVGEVNNESGPVAAFTWGVINGVYRMCMRAVVGVYEVVTFPIPLPKDYKPIIDDPEFFLSEGIF